jgi:hypothetical protein
MKTFFWVAVLILLLITFSGKEPLKTYREKLYEQGLQLIPTSWQSENQIISNLQRDLLALTPDLNQRQQRLITDAASNKDSLLQFRQRYCLDREFNSALPNELRQQSCAIIEQYYFRLSGN